MPHAFIFAAAALIALTLTPSLALAQQQEPAELTKAQYELMDRSHLARSNGELDEAARLLDEARAQGDHPYLRRYLGEVRLLQGNCTEAHELAVSAEYHDPWAMPGKDGAERARSSLLALIHDACPARLLLTCPEGVEVRLDEVRVACNRELMVGPGLYVITATPSYGVKTLPRRIIAQGASLTSLRLDPPDAEHSMAHWVPTSQQPVPIQDPDAEIRSSNLFLGSFFTGFGALIGTLSVFLVHQTYTGRDPFKNPKPGLTEEEQNQAELDYLRGEAYGWGGTVLGVGMLVAGGLVLGYTLAEDTHSETPGFSLGGGLGVEPWVGEVWGGALRLDF